MVVRARASVSVIKTKTKTSSVTAWEKNVFVR